MTQLMPLPLTVSCFSKIRTGFTFLVPAHQGSPGKRAVKRVCVCVCVCECVCVYVLLHHKVAHREYNKNQQNAKTLKQYDAQMHKRVSAIKTYKYLKYT